MDYYSTLFLLFSFILTFVYLTTISGRRNSRLPPGPYPLPIIGNLLELGDKPHCSLATLSKRYGPLMSLKLGSRTTIVVSSPDMAKEFFQTNDQFFSSRTIPDSGKVVDNDKYSIAWLPVGDQWRKLRRITKEYMFSLQHLDASEVLRKEKICIRLHITEYKNLLTMLIIVVQVPVNIGGVVFTTMLNVLSNFMFSKDLAKYDSASAHEFKDAVWSLLETMAILDRIIDEWLQLYNGVTPTNNDVLDLLLNLTLKDDDKFSQNDMRHLFFALFIAGSDTTSSTLEWAMAELIRNPKKIETTQLEITKYMEDNNKNIQESNISQLPYLQAVIKEALRLHPLAPFLVPHQAICDVEVQGFIVPQNAQILCNVWAMGRDPKIWPNPEAFSPERFLDVKIDYKGQDFELIPFGAGRRICPGLNMAHRMLHIILGSLVYKFDWKLEGNMGAENIDMDEKFGLTLSRNAPLFAIPTRL
ncbi:geraniol 8-hydroxylase-like protein [Tanacetum coccineum]